MAKTTKSVDGQYGLVELTFSAEAVAALASLTTAETIDISSIVARVEEGSTSSREVTEDAVVGDTTKIISPGTSLSAEEYTIYLYYTQGKETLGTDSIDVVTVLREAHKLATPVPIPFGWSIGGAVGDERFDTSATDTYLKSIGGAVPGEAGRKLIPVTVFTSETTPSTIA